jgi:hypothetical protein
MGSLYYLATYGLIEGGLTGLLWTTFIDTNLTGRAATYHFIGIYGTYLLGYRTTDEFINLMELWDLLIEVTGYLSNMDTKLIELRTNSLN